MVIADTSVWIPFFNQPGSPEKREIDALIDADRLVLVGVVLTELMQGCRTTSEANTISSKLTGLRFLETSFSSWRRAGELSFSLRRKASPFRRQTWSSVPWRSNTSIGYIPSILTSRTFPTSPSTLFPARRDDDNSFNPLRGH